MPHFAWCPDACVTSVRQPASETKRVQAAGSAVFYRADKTNARSKQTVASRQRGLDFYKR